MPVRPVIPDDPVELLTPRERQCLRLVDEHLSSKEIARKLGMSKTSVDTYCDRARRKLGVGDRYEAARLLRNIDIKVVPTGSGQDAIRTDTDAGSWPDDPASRETSDGRVAPQLRGPRDDRAGPPTEAGNRGLRGALADRGAPGRDDPQFHLGPAGAAAHGFVGDPGAGFDGPAPGLRDPQARPVQAF